MNALNRRVASALTVAGLVLLAGCSSATDDGDGDGDKAVADSPCAQEATKIVDSAREPAPLAIPEEPLDGSALAGKNIWMVTILTNQWSTAVADGFKAGVEGLGAEATIFDGQGLVNKWNEGIAQAVAQKADGIALLGIDPGVVGEAVKDAAEAGIPVVNAISGNYDADVPEGVFSNFSADYRDDGRKIAAWTLADSGCDASTLFMYATGVPLWEAQMEGNHEVYDELCPDDCEMIDQTVDLANVATDMARVTQTALTKDPDINYVYPGWDSAVTFAEPATVQVRPEASIVSRDGIVQALDAIRNGGTQKVTVATPPEQWIGWGIVDEIGRAIAGQEPGGVVVPTRLVDESNVGESNDEISPNYVGFEDKFLELWGVN